MAEAPRRPSRGWLWTARGAWWAGSLLAAVAGSLASAAAASGGVPVAARYEALTNRYPHGVLGDALEYETLVVTLSDGAELRVRHDPPLVFEDVTPRLWDIDGDGTPEIVTVESHAERGARLALWQVAGGALVPLAATPHIGTRFRWLAPVGAADLDGDGRIEIAFVDRPHLAKVLRLWRLEGAGDKTRLVEVAAAAEFSNHRIGWDHIAGGVRACGGSPELVLATGDWTSIVAVRFDGTLRARALAAYSDAAMANALACR